MATTSSASASGGDPFQMLIQDHRRVDDLFADLLATPNSAGPQRLQLAQKLKDELTAHALAEENVLYPMVKLEMKEKAKSQHLFAEHAEMKTLLGLLLHSNPGTDEWIGHAKTLQTAIQHHVGIEEKEIFPKAREALSAGMLRRVEQEMHEEKGSYHPARRLAAE
jgi:hemerythrin superfamily protein